MTGTQQMIVWLSFFATVVIVAVTISSRRWF